MIYILDALVVLWALSMILGGILGMIDIYRRNK